MERDETHVKPNVRTTGGSGGARKRGPVALAIGLAVLAGQGLPGREAPVAASADIPSPGLVLASLNREGLVAMPTFPSESRGNPVEHAVVLVHGWDTPGFASRKEYAEIARQVYAHFPQGRTQVLGVQWASDAGPRRKWIPQLLGHYFLGTLGFRNAVAHPYKEAVGRARTLGRGALRQLLFGVQDRFPSARLHVLAHSLGAEMTLRAMEPHVDLPVEQHSGLHRFDEPLRLDTVVFAGADIDHDFPQRVTSDRPHDPPALFWITVPAAGAQKDHALVLRKVVRGKAALGNKPLQVRQDQLDWLIGERHVYYDTEDIPRGHTLLQYYTPRRIARLAAVARDLRNPGRRPESVLSEIEAVREAPAQPEALAAFLAHSEATVRLYALWRLEHLLCGDAGHLADGSASRAADALHGDPDRFLAACPKSSCRAVRDGYWPPRPRLSSR